MPSAKFYNKYADREVELKFVKMFSNFYKLEWKIKGTKWYNFFTKGWHEVLEYERTFNRWNDPDSFYCLTGWDTRTWSFNNNRDIIYKLNELKEKIHYVKDIREYFVTPGYNDYLADRKAYQEYSSKNNKLYDEVK